MTRRLTFAALTLGLLAGCSTAPVPPPSAGHLRAENEAAPASTIPAPVQASPTVRKPRPAAKVETYSVVVNNVKVQELLFALARDARLNVDIHSGIRGNVTLNAIDQTLQQLLTRIAKQTDIRWEIDGQNLAVMPDLPYLKTYKVDYVNMSRDTTGSVTVTTQISATGASSVGTGGGAGAGSTSGSNNSITKVENRASNFFWARLSSNIKDILRETDKLVSKKGPPPDQLASSPSWNVRQDVYDPAEAEKKRAEADKIRAETEQIRARSTGSGGANPPTPTQANQTQSATSQQGIVNDPYEFTEAASVIVNPEAGIVTVRATSRQHEKIQEFLDQVTASARRQVLIEATVAEVSLSDTYQQGIDWTRLRLDQLGFKIVQAAVGGPAAALLEIGYKNPDSRIGNISGTVKLLETFGNVKVISSPKLSVLNNQTAILKVVDNLVYFTIKADTVANQSTTTTTYTTNLFSVPVGLVMNVTPQIGENEAVLLNIRPSISRQFGSVTDPNPDLQKLGVKNEIPVIRTREMETMIRVENGNTAVMGGLMEDAMDNTDNVAPGISRIPILGNIFQNRSDIRRKTELVVFLRPTVIRDASLSGDFANFREQLPGKDFFEKNPGPPQPYLRLEGLRQ